MPADEVTRESLREYYLRLSDQELLRILHSGELTPLAQEVAAAELQSRGIETSEPINETPGKDPDRVGGGDLVLLARFLSANEAEIVRSRLGAEGVYAVIADAHTFQVAALMGIAFGGVRILVPAPQREIAREILKEIGAGGSLADDAE